MFTASSDTFSASATMLKLGSLGCSQCQAPTPCSLNDELFLMLLLATVANAGTYTETIERANAKELRRLERAPPFPTPPSSVTWAS
jgi:hypothetical protein